MYFLVDIIAIAFILLLSLLGLKLGFFKSLVDVVLVVALFAGSAVGAYFTVTKFIEPTFGWQTELSKVVIQILGNSKISGGQDLINTIAPFISLGLLTFLFFIPYLIITNIVRKLILKLFAFINKVALFGFIDKLLGFVVNLVTSVAVVLALISIVYNLAPFGILTYSHEVLLSSEVLSLIYETNPLNSLLAPLFSILEGIIPV